MYEKQAVQQGLQIDMLDPPVDPLMRRFRRRNPRDIQAPPPLFSSSGSSSGLSGGGFDLSTISSFDTTGNDWKKSNESSFTDASSSSSSQGDAPKKAWWSF